MKKSACAIAGLAAVAAAILAPPAAHAEESLNAAAIRALFPGRFEGWVNGMARISISIRADGTILGRLFNKTDEGRWFLRGRALCIAWERWTDGKYQCSSVRREGDWLVAESGTNIKMRKI